MIRLRLLQGLMVLLLVGAFLHHDGRKTGMDTVDPAGAGDPPPVRAQATGMGSVSRGTSQVPRTRPEPDTPLGPGTIDRGLLSPEPEEAFTVRDRAIRPPRSREDRDPAPNPGVSLDEVSPPPPPRHDSRLPPAGGLYVPGEPDPANHREGTTRAPLSRDSTLPPSPPPTGSRGPFPPGGKKGTPLPTVRLIPHTTPVLVGERVTVDVRIQQGEEVWSVPFHLLYPPDLLEFEGGQAAGFLGEDPQEILFLADGAPGRLFVALTRFPPSEGSSGSGDLCRLYFRARRSGEANLRFEDGHLFVADRRETDVQFLPATLNIREDPELPPPPS